MNGGGAAQLRAGRESTRHPLCRSLHSCRRTGCHHCAKEPGADTEMSRSLPSPDLFDRIYLQDLVYQADCWKLCGDAHCCSFARYKKRFRFFGGGAPKQELILLPGEFEYLEARGWTAQFHGFERRTRVYEFGPGRLLYDTVTSARPGCACDHETRTTVCRLYPMLPVLGPDGALAAVEPLGLYEELEHLDGLESACRLDSLPFPQINVYLELAALLGSDPVLCFHLAAYRLAKRNLANGLRDARDRTGKSAFALFETALLRRRLFDHETLRAELAELWRRFEETRGSEFALAMDGIPHAEELQENS